MAYSLSKILDKRDVELTELALIYQLDPKDPNLKREIIEILADEGTLIHDYVPNLPIRGISLDEFICQKLLNSDYFLYPNEKNCSPLSGRIANNLIKVGAMRIFSDVMKSFVEPVVNAIDAYQIKEGKRPVGKFGVGFYSLLYWVIKFPGSYLQIYSNPIPGPDEEASQPWEAVITDTSLKVRSAKREEGVRFRLRIFVLSNESGVYDEVVDTLRNITSAKVKISFLYDVDSQSEKREILFGKGELVKVDIYQTEEHFTFTVEDNALGLPIYALGDLLVPSLSSKTIQSSSVRYIPKVGALTEIKGLDYEMDEEDHLINHPRPREIRNIILIGEIRLLWLSGEYGIQIQLSPQTPLPVSRDDILFSNPLVREEFEMNVFYLLDRALERNPRFGPMELLKMLRGYPNGRYLVPIIIQEITERGYHFVPIKYFLIYQQITDRKLFGSNSTLSIEMENLFIRERSPNFNLLVGRGVYFIEIPSLTFADSTRLVFLPKSEVDDENIASWILLYQEYSLIPVGSKWNSSEVILNIIDKYIGFFRPEDLLQVLLGRVYGLRSIFKEESVLRAMDRISEVVRWNSKILPQMVAGFLKVSGLYKPAVTYGSAQKELLINQNHISSVIPKGWENLYLELFEKLIPLMVEEDVIYIYNDSVLEFSIKLNDLRDKVQNIEEWLYLALFYRSSGIKFGSQSDLLLDYWRTYLRSEGRIQMMLRKLLYPKYFFNGKYYSLLDDTSESTIIIPSLNYYRLNEKISAQISTLPLPPKLQMIDGRKYYLSKLLQNVFEKKSLNNISTERGDLPIQILEIAINEATNKPPLEAMITETFQNSLDARKSNNNEEPIRINFGRNGSLLSYSIIDRVGITPDGITALSIPFLSSKTDPFLAGSIGSGFFTVYNRASTVNIITVKNGIETVIVDVPLRESGRVIDVKRTIGQREGQSPSTTITVYFGSDEPEKELSMLLTYCQNVLPLTTDRFYLNGRRIYIKTEPLRDFSSPRMSARIGTDFESYILTKGAPFTVLEGSDIYRETAGTRSLPKAELSAETDYLERFIGTGLVINLKEGFEPTQGRTKIRIENKTNYEEDVKDILYYYVLTKQLENPYEDYVRNFTSRGRIRQILPPVSIENKDHFNNLGDFLWYHIPLNATENLSKIVDKMIKREENTKSTSLQTEIAKRWLENKDLKTDFNLTNIEISELSETSSITQGALDFAQSFVDAFVESLNSSSEAPEVLISPNEGFKGLYDSEKNEIVLSLTLKITDPPKTRTLDNILGYLGKNNDIYGKKYPSATLIHELEHFRRRENHGIDSHQDVIINGKNYTFNESANYHYDLAVKNGLLNLML